MNTTLGEIKNFVARGNAAQKAVDKIIGRASSVEGREPRKVSTPHPQSLSPSEAEREAAKLSAYIVQRKHGRTKFYLTHRGGWSVDPDEAKHFSSSADALKLLGSRVGSVIPVAPL